MKRLFLSTLIALLSMVAYAEKIEVVFGDSKFFKKSSGDAILVFDFDGATYDYKKPLEEQYENLEELKVVAYNGFIEEFNDRCKTCQVIKDESKAKYKITVKVVNMDKYVKVTGFIPSPATKAWGVLTITEINSDKKLFECKFNEIDGGANPSPDGTFSDCFEDLGKRISKLK